MAVMNDKPEYTKENIADAVEFGCFDPSMLEDSRPDLKQIAKEWVWATKQKRFVRRSDGMMWDMQQFDGMFNYATDKASVSKAMFKTKKLLRRVESIAFQPGKPIEYDNKFNIWRPSPIVAKRNEDAAMMFFKHLAWLFPETDCNHVLNWLAWVYQHQDLKPTHALLIVGETFGTGKSFVARVFERLIGMINTQRPKNSSLTGQFNGWVAQCKLAIIEELMQIGRREVANELRDMITEPTIEVNIKNVPAFLIESFLAMMAITNHTNAIPVEKGDRRWLLGGSAITIAQKEEKDAAGYYAKLMAVLDDQDALSGIAWELKHRNLGRYTGHGMAPLTDIKRTMIQLTTSDINGWLTENVHNDPLNRRLVNIRADIVPAIPEDIRRTARGIDKAIAIFLAKELQGVNLDDHKVQGKVVKLWSINGPSLAKLEPAERVAMYLKGKPVDKSQADGTSYDWDC
jgi:Family of unknown function (DUF5906)